MKKLHDKAIEAIGWAYADCCAELDRGGDPRKAEMPRVLARAEVDLADAEQDRAPTMDAGRVAAAVARQDACDRLECIHTATLKMCDCCTYNRGDEPEPQDSLAKLAGDDDLEPHDDLAMAVFEDYPIGHDAVAVKVIRGDVIERDEALEPTRTRIEMRYQMQGRIDCPHCQKGVAIEAEVPDVCPQCIRGRRMLSSLKIQLESYEAREKMSLELRDETKGAIKAMQLAIHIVRQACGITDGVIDDGGSE